MPNKITYTITTSDGKSHQVSEENIQKYGMGSYADAYKGATIRMRDNDGADYDIPLGNYDDARQQGLRPYRFEHIPAKGGQETSAGGNKAGKEAQRVVDEYDRSVAMNSRRQQAKPVTTRRAANNGHQMTDAERQSMMNWASATSQTVRQSTSEAKRRVSNLQERARKPLRVRNNNLGAGATPYQLGENPNVVEAGQSFDPASGKTQPTYITSSGNEFDERRLADLEQNQIDDTMDKSVSGQIRRAQERLQELSDKAAQRRKELLDENNKRFNGDNGLFSGLSRAKALEAVNNSDQTLRELELAMRQTEKQIQTLEEQRDRENGNEPGFWSGFASVISDPTTWDFGASSVRDAATMLRASDNNRTKTAQEESAYQEMMRSIYANQQAEAMYGGNASFMNRAGKMTGYMPSFMIDFAVTGGAIGGFNAAGRAATKAATKALGKETIDQMAKLGFKTYIKRYGAKGLAKEATNWTIKALGTTADDLVVATGMTGTIQGGKTAADTVQRKLGDVTIDENGNYDFTNDKTWGSAAWQAGANSVIENLSEKFGAHLPDIGSLKNLGKLANVIGAKKLGGVLARANAGALGNITKTTSRLFEKLGVSDYLGEVSEEYYGQLWRTMLNLDDAYQQNADGTRTNLLATKQFHGDIWGGMALSMGLMGAAKGTFSAANYMAMKHDVNKADAIAREVLTPDVWDPLRSVIDNAKNENIGEVAESIMSDNEMSGEEKAAVLNYMERSMYLRGANLAEVAESRGGNEDEESRNANASYINGYNTEETADKQDVKNRYEQNVSVMTAGLGISEEELESRDWLSEARREASSGTDEGRQRASIILDYVNSKQAYEGMIQRVRDDIDSRVEESNQMVDSRVNKSTGMIQGATMKAQKPDGTDRKVYVVSGSVVTLEDGSGIDREKSDNSVMVRDAETGELEMVSPESIFTLEQPIDPETEKQTAAETIRQTYAQEAANAIDGTVAFNQGDTYTLTDENGQASQVQVVANQQGVVDNGDGTVNVSPDGGQTIVPMRKEDIQSMVDATSRARVAQPQQPTQQPQQEAQTSRQAQQPQATLPVGTYNQEDELSLLDENGNVVNAMITFDREADGRYTVESDSPINGNTVNRFTAEELDGMRADNAMPVDNADVSAQQQTSEDSVSTRGNVDMNMPTVNMPQVNIADDTETGEGESDTQEGASPIGETVTVDGVNGVVVGERPGAYEVRWDDGKQTIVPNFEFRRMRWEMSHQPTTQGPSTEWAQAVETQQPAMVQSQEPAGAQGLQVEPRQSALERIPKDEQGQPIYEQADPDTAWDAVVEQTQGDATMAKSVVDSMVADKEAALRKAEKSKPKGGATIAEKIAAEQQRKNEIDQARATLEQWQRIALTPQRRAAAEMNELARQEEEAARQRRELEAQRRIELEEAERQRREALRGVPDIIDDTPRDARARGYRRVNGEKVDRQQPLQATQGREVQVKFDNKNLPTGHATLIDASQLQPSHLNGQRNPAHFLDEAQPKERTDDASVMEARRIAANIRPEEITSMPTAYTGAPTVNMRGEVIQGNNRGAALREMWAVEPEQAQQYKQYLKEHAAEFGLTPEDVDAMEQPVLVKMLDVDDADAITLGQFEAQDTESGGTERIKAKNVAQKMDAESDMKTFANQMLNSPDEEMTFTELIDRNGAGALEWMNRKGYITPTQYRSAFDSKGNLTAEAKNDLKGIMYQSIFQNGNTHLEEMFGALPAKAQRAILAVAYRDYDSPNTERMNDELQASISAYYALSQVPEFANAKNFKEARSAAEAWKRQLAFDDVTGESYLPSEKYSNFAVLLATMYKGQTQRFIQNTLGNIYDLVQGTQEATLFEEPDNTPRTLAEAIYEAINKRAINLLLNGEFEYNGQRRSNVLAGGSAAGQQGRQGSEGNATAGGRAENSARTDDGSDRVANDTGNSGSERNDRGNQSTEKKEEPAEGQLTKAEAAEIIADMEEHAEVAPEMELTIENWDALFGEDGIVNTPLGEVKMGENQFAKLMRQGRNGKLGMVKPTLESPDIIIEDESKAKDNDITERPSSYIFVKTFLKKDGSRYYYFTSITVNKDGREVVVSSQEKSRNRILRLMLEGSVIWRTPKDAATSSAEKQGLDYAHPDEAEDATKGSGITPQSTSSVRKDTQTSSNEQGITEKIAEEEEKVEQNPTDAQKKAGNYQKGHVKIDGYDVTIENPKGSVRRGTDANGNAWETTMHNTYGYIRGTEGVDGDHIDVFLSDDPTQGDVYVIDQVNPDTGEFDEHKVMYGFKSALAAKRAYLSNYSPDWKGLGAITKVSKEEFKKWINSSHRKTKPFAEYKGVNGADEKTERAGDAGKAARIEKLRKSKPIMATGEEYKGKYELNNKAAADYINKHLKGEYVNKDTGTPIKITRKGAFKVTRHDAENEAHLKSVALIPQMIENAIFIHEEQNDKGSNKFDSYRYYVTGLNMGGIDYTVKLTVGVKNGETYYDHALTEIEKSNLIDRIDEISSSFTGNKAAPISKSKDKRLISILQTNDGKNENNGKTGINEADGTDVPSPSEGENPVDYARRLGEWRNNRGNKAGVVGGNTLKQLTDRYDEIKKAHPYHVLLFEVGDKYVSIKEDAETSSKALNIPIDKNGCVSFGKDKLDESLQRIISNGHGVALIEDISTPENDGGVRFREGNNEISDFGAKNKLVTRERYEELKKRMRQKLYGQLNMGIDPEILAIGTEMAAYHIEAGARKFADYARNMISDLGEAIRPYLKAFYNGARDLPEVQEAGYADEMTSYEEVRTFDTANFDKAQGNAMDTAEMVVAEQEANRQADAAKKQITDERNKKTSKKRSANKKKAVSSQQMPDLFGNMNETQNQGSDERIQELQQRTAGERTDRQPDNQTGEVGEGQRREAEQPARGRVDTGSGTDVRNDGERGERLADVPESEHRRLARNRNNNHAERGKDYSPTSPKSRYDANVKAITLAKELTDSGQQATEEQKAVLRQFSGWGGLGTFFNNRETREKLVALLGDDGYQQAAMSINSAYYTPANVIDTMWDIVGNLGFNGGNILEGSAGIGNILGLMPMNISDRSNIQAVEIDGLSGMILKLLYPDAQVDIQGFENTQVRNGSVDLAITNVPFVTGLHVHDTTGDRDLSRRFGNIHDFCIAKNIRKLREGGIGVFISSSGTLDKSKSLRDWVTNEGNADFIGAFRLNNNTFGGTNATSDIIIVRKRVGGKKSAGAIDLSETESVRAVNVPVNDNGREKIKPVVLQYNKYFVEHPENMGGEMALNYERGENFRAESSGLFPTNGINQLERMRQWAETFKGKSVDTTAPQVEAQAETTPVDNNGNQIKDGTLVVGRDGSINVVYMGRQEPLGVNDKKVKGHPKSECLEDYNRIKRALNAVLEYETTNDGDKGLSPLLKELNDAYDSFKDKYGNLNKNTAIAFLRNDIDFPSIQALEKYSETNDKNGKRVAQTEKASIFKERVVQKETEPHPTNVEDAVKTSVFNTGKIDLDYISDTLGWKSADVEKEIIDKGLGYRDPSTGDMEVSYKYLTGNVREKLAIAEVNNEDGRYDKNIKALRKIVPMDIPAHLIEFTFGSSWVNPRLYVDYIKEKTGVDVTLTNIDGQWNMKLPYFVETEKNKSEGVRSETLRKVVLGTDLMNAAINNRTITVSSTRKTSDGKSETITDKDATQACSVKIDDIRNDFKDWARSKMQSDPELAREIERVYNDRFNNYVPVQVPDAFVSSHFPGASMKINLFPHQSKAAIRATGQSIMLAHEVGTGKTFTLITTAMEMRRLGLARKPMIVVQNATVGQFVASAKELYPNAKVLTIADNERNEEGRKRFYAKIKYNDWDMIVVPQSVFERIPDSEERQMDFINERIEEKQHVLEQMQDIDPKSVIARNAKRELDNLQTELAEVSGKKKQRDEKRAAKTRQNASAKAQEQLDRATDDVENFDDMEIDAVLVDEAHEYKHLGFSTSMQRGVKGIDPSYSKKSAGVYLKTRAVMDKSGGKNVVFATGTPISNTAAEIWTFMRYLMPKHTMEEYGIYYFDDFVRNFGNLTQMLEFTTSGKFRENNRFAGYVNIPELMRIWSGVADTVLTSETNLKDKLPETVEGGQKATDIYLPQSASLRSIMKAVRAELERFDNMTGKEKKENSAIPLVMYGIAKAAAIDPRLVMADAVDEPMSKTNRAVDETLKSLEETKKYKGTVAIFCDTYQNKDTGFNIYEEIKRKLVERGVPAGQIVIMRSGMSVNKKAEIFDKVNAGDIRVIMGSTFTLGTGVNIQERLNTLIHLDAPNRPMDYTQRNGRILRQGNLHKQWGIPVKILRFGVEDSLDITAYQRLKTKGAIADSVMEGKKFLNDNQQDRTLEEQEDVFGDTVAQLSGSEYALLKNQAEREFRKYNNKKKQYDADQIYVHNAIPRYEGQIKRSEETIKQQRKALADVEKAFPDGKVNEITIGNSKLSSQKEIGDYIKDKVNKSQSDIEERVRKSTQGTKAKSAFTLKAGPFTFTITTEYEKDNEFKGGSLFPVVHRNMTYTCDEIGLEDVPVQRASFKNAVDDIMDNVLSGNDMRERIETETNSIERNSAELKQLKERDGKPFENEKELEDARKKVDEYTEKMKAEMQAKEKKYAEMDAQTKSADLGSLSGAEEADEDGDVLFREVGSDISDVNERFNEQLDGLTEENADRVTLSLGRPSPVLRSAGVEDKPMKLYGNKVMKKMRKHGFTLDELHDLPQAVANPIAVFKNYGKDGNRSILTELRTEQGNFLVTLTLGEGHDVDFNIVTSVFGKGESNIIDWIKRGFATYINKGKALDYLHHSALKAVTSDNQELVSAANIVRNFENPNISEENFREGRGTLSDDELSYENDPFAKMVGRSTRTAAQRRKFAAQKRQHMVDAAQELIDKLHLDNVDIVTDASALQGRRSKAKGFYSRSTGRITIVIPNHANIQDVEQTILHEAVAHYGLRKLFGKHFDTFLDNVLQSADEDVRRRIVNLAEKHGWDFRTATEEYLASLAEKTDFENTNASWWQRIKTLFMQMLHKIGFEDFSGVPLSDNELRYLLWRSYENLAKPGRYRSILGEAEDVAKQYELKVGNYAPASEVADNAADMTREEREELEMVNGRFNEELDGLTEENASSTRLKLGTPSPVLLSAGIPDKPLILYGNKLLKKAKSHGYSAKDIKNLPKSLHEPIAVFEGSHPNSYAVLAELRLNGKNSLISIETMKNGEVDFNIISSVFGKNEKGVVKWIEDGKLLYADKEKALSYISASAPIADATYKKELVSVANIVRNFENPKLPGEKDLLFREDDLDTREESLNGRVDGASPLENTTIKAWDNIAQSTRFKLVETAFDYLNAVDKFQKLIAQHSGKSIKDFENAYDAMSFLSSKNRTEMDMFDSFIVTPLNNAIVKLVGEIKKKDADWSKGRLRDLVKYVEAKHGIDRNRQMAVESVAKEDANGESVLERWSKAKKEINGRNDIGWNEKQQLLDEEAINLGADLSRDYSGLSSVFGNEEEYPDGWQEGALGYVTAYENDHAKEDIDGLWKAIGNATGYTLQKQYETGLVSREYVARQKDRFDNYIPLRGFEDDTAGDVYDYIGDDYYPGGNPVKTARGRTSEAGNPFGSILNTAYASIAAGNKNVAKAALYSLVRNHDTGGLAVVNKAWAVKYANLVTDPDLSGIIITPQIIGDEEIPEWVEAVPRIPQDATAEEISEILGKFERVMNKYRGESIAKPISKRSKIKYRTLHKERGQHEIPLFIGGDKYVITITGNPRVAQAMNGLLNPDSGDVNKLTEIAKRTQRFMSSAFTAKNPAFSLANLTKDSIYANNQTFIRENPMYWLRFTKNQKAGFGELPLMMSRLLRFQKGTLDPNDSTDSLFKEFMENGGATGYTFVNSQEEYAKELEKRLRDLSTKTPKALTPQGLWKITFDAIEFAGQSAELVNRFAAYKTSRELGRPVSRSVRDAKEITVNFNRKGAGRKTASKNNKSYINFAAALSQYGQMSILFWNANMQAKYRFFKNMQEHPIKTGTTLIGNSMLIAGVLLPVLNNILLPALYDAFGDGDDDDKRNDYFNALTDYERTHNLCVRLPKGYWLKVPVSPEMTPWFAIGDAIGGSVAGKRELTASDFIHSLVDAVSPINVNWEYKGWTFALNFAPTVGQPIAQNMMNVNFMGNPIKKEPFTSSQNMNPEYTMVYRSASPTLVELSRLNNRVFGGEDDKTNGRFDWNPSMIQNFISGYTGGYGTTTLSLADWIVNTSKGENQSVTFSKMPLVSRFMISGDKDLQLQRVNSRFYDVKHYVDEFEYDMKRYEKRIEEGQKEGNPMKVAKGVSDYQELLSGSRANKYIELKNYTDSVDAYEDYVKEFPDDEITRDLLFGIKSRGIELLQREDGNQREGGRNARE